MFGHFYNNSVRNLVVGFGTLFNEIDVKRYNGDGTVKESLRVPLGYGPKEKFLVRLNQPASIDDGVDVRMTAPRLGFELTGFAYDTSRKRNTLSKRINTGAVDGASSVRTNFAEVPYTFDFSLSIFVRHMDDGLQIIEQILPYFTPEFIITLNLNNNAQKVDVPIVLTSVTNTAEYDGDFDSGRLINFDLNFTAKSYVYGPIKDSKIIKKAIVTNFLPKISLQEVASLGQQEHCQGLMLVSLDPAEINQTLLRDIRQILNYMFVAILRVTQEDLVLMYSVIQYEKEIYKRKNLLCTGYNPSRGAEVY